MSKPLYELVNEQKELYELLEDGSYIDEDGIVDPRVIELLKNQDKDIRRKAVSCAVIVKQLRSDAEAIEAEEKRLQERRRRLEKNAESLAGYLSGELQRAGLNGDRISDPQAVISFRRSERVEITNESALPPEFTKTKVEPNKTAIRDAFKRGEEVAGAELVEVQNIQIK